MIHTIAAVLALAIWIAVGLTAEPRLARARTGAQPNRPEPMPITLDPATTAVLVLDLSARCDNPNEVCSQLIPGVRGFLSRARASNVFVAYTVSLAARGTPLGNIAVGIEPVGEEPVIYPDHFDKFAGGELQSWLADRGIQTVIITGSSTNSAVMYTATTAARVHRYQVVIPVDGINAAGHYEQEYTLHQFTVLPGGAAPLFSFTTLDMISFARL